MRQAGPDTSHRLHLQLLSIHRLYLVEGSMGADDHEGGSCRTVSSSGCILSLAPNLTLPRPFTHPGPRRQQSQHLPARRRGKRRHQPGRTDALGSPLGLGTDGIGQLFPPDPPLHQSSVTSSGTFYVIRQTPQSEPPIPSPTPIPQRALPRP